MPTVRVPLKKKRNVARAAMQDWNQAAARRMLRRSGCRAVRLRVDSGELMVDSQMDEKR